MREDLRWLDEAGLRALLPWTDAVSALEHALLGGLDPEAALQRSSHELSHGQLLVMPAETATAFGVKLGTVAPGNPERGAPRIQALYVLYDRVTLAPTALIDGTALTTLRTPAVSALAVAHLAAPEASALVVFGSGPQAWGHVEAIRTIRPLRSVTVVGRDAGRARALADRVGRSGLDAAVGDPQAVAAADVVVCATTARQPVFDGALLPEHACVVAVGSHEPAARELDARTLAGAARIVVETPAVALREAGDVIVALEAGAISAADLMGLAGAVRMAPPAGRSVFKSVGMGWQDLVLAELAYQRWTARQGGAGPAPRPHV